MHFRIEAQLLQGEPRLRIFDAESGALRLQWRYRATLPPNHRDHVCSDDRCAARANLHALMRDLFLLSCVSKASLPNLGAATDACMYCDRCAVGDAEAGWFTTVSHLEQS